MENVTRNVDTPLRDDANELQVHVTRGQTEDIVLEDKTIRYTTTRRAEMRSVTYQEGYDLLSYRDL